MDSETGAASILSRVSIDGGDGSAALDRQAHAGKKAAMLSTAGNCARG